MSSFGLKGADLARVLDVDPDLSSGLATEEASAAAKAALARILRVERGEWSVPEQRPRVGFLIVDGLLARTVVIAGIGCTYLVGPGDLLRPWDDDEGYRSVPIAVQWDVVEPARIAVLDERFAAVMTRWPPVATNLLARTLRHEQSLAIQLAITCLTGVKVRVHVALWHLADRWGRVERDGVVVPLPLTHETIGRLVRTRRPSVSTALKQLSESGLVTRRDDGAWLLRGSAPTELGDLQSGVHDARADESDSSVRA